MDKRAPLLAVQFANHDDAEQAFLKCMNYSCDEGWDSLESIVSTWSSNRRSEFKDDLKLGFWGDTFIFVGDKRLFAVDNDRMYCDVINANSTDIWLRIANDYNPDNVRMTSLEMTSFASDNVNWVEPRCSFHEECVAASSLSYCLDGFDMMLAEFASAT